MKNVVISALCAYIYYDLCVVKYIWLAVVVFLLVWLTIAEAEETIKDFNGSVRRGQRLNKRINDMKGVRF